ncbi:hypothetical protein [Streptomyces sp. NPDC056304]|uniref:hypothetical protein n=1 Tax=Streptomyces sp. NPDC056304 TaxID=3345778 RepID=UPI0035D81631
MSRFQPFAGSVSGGTVFLIGGALEQIGGGRLGDERFTERFTDTLMTKMSDHCEPAPLHVPLCLTEIPALSGPRVMPEPINTCSRSKPTQPQG